MSMTELRGARENLKRATDFFVTGTRFAFVALAVLVVIG